MFRITCEKTLTARERLDLPASEFGLPDERKYPLTDEKHVRQAIRFFRYCPPVKRTILAKNINKRMKELGMSVKISENSPFYHYAMEKGPVKESYEDELKHHVDVISKDIRRGDILKRIVDEISLQDNFDGLAKYEKTVMEFIRTNLLSKVYGYNPVSVLNDSLNSFYQDVIDFVRYNSQGEKDGSEYLSALYLINDIRKAMFVAIDDQNIEKMNGINSWVMTLFKTVPGLYYPLWRALAEVYVQIQRYKNENVHNVYITVTMSDIITHTMEYMDSNQSDQFTSIEPTKLISLIMDNEASFPLDNFSGFLDTIKKRLESELYIITKSPYNDITEVIESSERLNSEMKECLGELKGRVNERNVKWLSKQLSAELTEMDMVTFRKSKESTYIFTDENTDGNCIYYCHIEGDQVYLITKDIDRERHFFLIKLCDGNDIFPGCKNLVCSSEEFDTSLKMKAVCITVDVPDYSDWDLRSVALTEGITFDQNGVMKITFNPKKSLMDEYAENHALLMQNFKSENIDAMKTNLAYHFAIISYVEREVIHGKKKLSDQKKDIAMKARMFAMNDFKTYMKVVQQKDPTFNFSEYYQNGDYGKVSFRISSDDVRGIRKLFRSIMYT